MPARTPARRLQEGANHTAQKRFAKGSRARSRWSRLLSLCSFTAYYARQRGHSGENCSGGTSENAEKPSFRSFSFHRLLQLARSTAVTVTVTSDRALDIWRHKSLQNRQQVISRWSKLLSPFSDLISIIADCQPINSLMTVVISFYIYISSIIPIIALDSSSTFPALNLEQKKTWPVPGYLSPRTHRLGDVASPRCPIDARLRLAAGPWSCPSGLTILDSCPNPAYDLDLLISKSLVRRSWPWKTKYPIVSQSSSVVSLILFPVSIIPNPCMPISMHINMPAGLHETLLDYFALYSLRTPFHALLYSTFVPYRSSQTRLGHDTELAFT